MHGWAEMSADSKPHQNVPNILIIEDNSADVDLLKFGLTQTGERYVLEVLADGEEALGFIEEHRAGARHSDPCVIVLDLHLPRYNGVQILNAIRRTPMLSHIHVVVLTGFASPKEEFQVNELGGLCMRKPFDLNGYLALAQELLSLCKGYRPVAAGSL